MTDGVDLFVVKDGSRWGIVGNVRGLTIAIHGFQRTPAEDLVARLTLAACNGPHEQGLERLVKYSPAAIPPHLAEACHRAVHGDPPSGEVGKCLE